RGRHYFFTATAGGEIDRNHPTQVSCTLARLGIEHACFARSPLEAGSAFRQYGRLWRGAAGKISQNCPRKGGVRRITVIRLYDYILSGNCYKLRLMMRMLGVDYETRQVDFYPGREHKSDWFLKLNPLGQLPVLEDGDLILRDAQAILVYLASKYDDT